MSTIWVLILRLLKFQWVQGWMVKVLVGMVGMVIMMVGMVGRLKLVGLCTKAGRLTAHGNFFPKMEKDSRNHPL